MRSMIGEIAAAFAAGHLTASEAIYVAYYRGLVVSRSTRRGAMIAVALSPDEANHTISELKLEGHIRVACINSPESVTLSGDQESITQIEKSMQDNGVFARILRTDQKAYHSHHMEVVAQEYKNLLTFLSPTASSACDTTSFTPMVSSVDVCEIGPQTTRSPAYWLRNLTSPVLFSDAASKLMIASKVHFIEIGPHGALALPIKQIRNSLDLAEPSAPYSPTISRGGDSVSDILGLIGTLFNYGHDIEFEKVNDISVNMPLTHSRAHSAYKAEVLYDLPRYHWNYTTPFFHEPRSSIEYRSREYPRHDLLGSKVSGGSGHTALFRNFLRIKDVLWLEDHKLGSNIVFPGACYIAMAVEALFQVHHDFSVLYSAVELRQVKIKSVLNLSDEKGGAEIFTEIRSPDSAIDSVIPGLWLEFIISSFAGSTSTTHANGLIRLDKYNSFVDSLSVLPSQEMEHHSCQAWYESFAAQGLNFGPKFRSMVDILADQARKQRLATIKTQLAYDFKGALPGHFCSRYLIHPITIDSMFQATILASCAGQTRNLLGRVPVSIGYARLEQANLPTMSELCRVNATSESVGFGPTINHADLLSSRGNTLMQLRDVREIVYQDTAVYDKFDGRSPMLRVEWKPDTSSLTPKDANSLTKYMDRFSNSRSNDTLGDEIRIFGQLIDLIAHENTQLRFLDLGSNQPDISAHFLKVLGAEGTFKRFQNYARGTFSESGNCITITDESVDATNKSSTPEKALHNVILMPWVCF